MNNPRLGPLTLFRKIGQLLGLKQMTLPTGIGRIRIRPADSDARTFRQIFRKRPYDVSPFPQDQRVNAAYREIIKSGRRPVIIDAGANVGAASCWFSLRFPGATIVAIEPDAGNAAILRRNVQNRSNVQVIEAAIGSASGNVHLVHGKYSWATQTERASEGGVKILTVPEAVRLAGEDAVLFIAKIDIEGFESDLFAKNTEWAATAPLVFVEPHADLFPGKGITRNLLRVFSESGHELLITGGDTLAFVL